MKKLMIMAAFMVAAVTANAQGEVGSLTIQPKIGMNLSLETGFNESKMRVGMAGGIEAEYVIAEKFSVAAGVLYSKQGVRFKDWTDELLDKYENSRYSTDYLNIPIVANYYIIPGLAIKAGIQPGFLFGAKYKEKINGTKISEDAKDGYKKFDLSIPLGASYEYKNVVFDVRYNLGVLNIGKNTDKTYRNSVIQFTLGYKLPVK